MTRSAPASRDESRARTQTWTLCWAILAAAAGAVTAPLEPNVLEEGIVVHTAERMLQGEHLYRDVISHTAPLSYELLALLFRIFGDDMAVARAAIVALQALGGALCFASARRAGAGAYAHLAAASVAAAPVLLIPLFSTFYYTTLAFYLALAAVYTGLRTPEGSRWALATGVLLAACALCKQSLGVVATAVWMAALAISLPATSRVRRLAAVAAGGVAVAIATLCLYASRGDLESFLYSQIELAFLMSSADSFGTPLINFWPIGELSGVAKANWVMYLPSFYHLRHGLFTVIGTPIIVFTQLLYALPFAALAWTLVHALRGRATPAIWLHGAFLLTMTSNLYPRADWGHITVSLPPALVQVALLAPGGATSVGRWATRGLTLALSVAVIGTGVWLYELAGPRSFGPRIPLRPVSRSLRAPSFPRVIHYLRRHTNPGEAIFVARQEPLLYYATNTTNPTPFEGVLQGVREMQEEQILPALEKVRFVVMSDIDQPLFTYYSDQLPAVWAHFERHFQIPPEFRLDDASWVTVARRGRDRGPTAIDFHERRAGARSWIRDRNGRPVERASSPQHMAARHFNRPFPIELGALGGGIDFPVEVPADAVFQAGVGYRGVVSNDHQYIHPPVTTAIVSVRLGDAPEFVELAAIAIDDHPRSGRQWSPVEIDLAPYAGPATLRLEFRAKRRLGRDRVAWFGSPRIALRPPAPGLGTP